MKKTTKVILPTPVEVGHCIANSSKGSQCSMNVIVVSNFPKSLLKEMTYLKIAKKCVFIVEPKIVKLEPMKNKIENKIPVKNKNLFPKKCFRKRKTYVKRRSQEFSLLGLSGACKI